MSDEEKPTFTEFLDSNRITGQLSGFSKHARAVWDTVPEIASRMLSGLWSLFGMIFVKLRTLLVFQLTEDLSRLERARSVWDRCEMMNFIEADDDSTFDHLVAKLLKKAAQNTTRINYLKKLRVMVKKGMRRQFLTFYIEQSDDHDFAALALQLNELLHLDQLADDPSEAPVVVVERAK